MRIFWLIIPLLFSTLCFGAEYKTGLVIPKDWQKTAKFESAIKRDRAVPAEFDWRTQKTLSPIMNQGNCGSCWAFSASATFRDALVVQAGQTYANSTQEVLDCNAPGYGCDGGYFDVDQFFVSPGTATETDYGAYVAKKQSCKQVTKSAKALSWAYVAQGGNGKPSDAEIKAAIYAYGPVSVGVAADSNFQNYSGGVFTNCTARQLNHAVQLVGWSDSGGYWIMRNSWGTGWGEKGYMRLKYGCDGIGEAANFFKVSDQPTPEPTPEPTPGPDPKPCTMPKASTGWPSELQVQSGKTYVFGRPAVSGVTYAWTADPEFSNGAKPTTATIRYAPYMTKTLTVTATNDCGSASASTKAVFPNSRFKNVYH